MKPSCFLPSECFDMSGLDVGDFDCMQLPTQEESELLSLLWKLDEEMVTSLHKTIRCASMSGSKACRKMINKELACRHRVEFLLGKVRLHSDDLCKIRSNFNYLQHGSFRK